MEFAVIPKAAPTRVAPSGWSWRKKRTPEEAELLRRVFALGGDESLIVVGMTPGHVKLVRNEAFRLSLKVSIRPEGAGHIVEKA